MTIRKEITIGQLFVIVVTVLSAGAFAWRAYADVRVIEEETLQLKKQAQELAEKMNTVPSTELVKDLQGDVNAMRQDIRDIRNVVFHYLGPIDTTKVRTR